MYHIDSKQTKPDIEYMLNKIQALMKRGVAVGDIAGLYNRYLIEQESLSGHIKKAYRILNPNSTNQIIAYMKGLENSEVYEVGCIDGKWSTNKDVLESLSSLGYQFSTDILDYRKYKKQAESVKSIMDAVGSDGRVHPCVSLSKTNRINYSAPALMNIPKSLLWHIIKPIKPGNILISADIKNQEPNILINLLNAEELKAALLDDRGLYETLFFNQFKAKATLNIMVMTDGRKGVIPNEELAMNRAVPPVYYAPTPPAVETSKILGERVRCIHVTNIATPLGEVPELPDTVIVETFSGKRVNTKVIWGEYSRAKLNKPQIITITGDLPEVEIECTGVYRKEFKTAWNAMTYGAGMQGVDSMCKVIDGKSVYRYYSQIKEFKHYRQRCTQLANKGIQTINTYFGTQLYAGVDGASRLQRVLMDIPVQGTGADILSILIKHFYAEVDRLGLSGKLDIAYSRHDELIFEVDKAWASEVGLSAVKDIISNLVEHQVDDWIPFKVEVSVVETPNI